MGGPRCSRSSTNVLDEAVSYSLYGTQVNFIEESKTTTRLN